MVTPRTGNPRGRPKGSKNKGPPKPPKSLVDDPERHAIAIALAMLALGRTEQAAWRLGAIQVVGHDVTAEVEPPTRPRGGTVPAGWLWMSWKRDDGPGKPTTDIDGKADTLRRKFDDREAFTADEAEWLHYMVQAVITAIAAANPKISPRDVERCCDVIMWLCDWVGEVQFGEHLVSLLGLHDVGRVQPVGEHHGRGERGGDVFAGAGAELVTPRKPA